MAKEKKTAKEPGDVPEVKTVAIKMSPAFHSWLTEWSDEARVSVPVLIEHALLEMAGTKGWTLPPKRTAR